MKGGQDEYNEIFEKLTEIDLSGRTDIGAKHALGLIAYGIYKQDKREFIHLWRQETGEHPSADEIRRWVKDRTRESQLRKLRKEARTVVSELQKEAVSAATPYIRVETLKRAWWPNVWSSFGATLIYTVGLITLSVVLAVFGVDAFAVFRTVIDALQ